MYFISNEGYQDAGGTSKPTISPLVLFLIATVPFLNTILEDPFLLSSIERIA